jgi:cbb3-type cytochrome oxidase maturation protein
MSSRERRTESIESVTKSTDGTSATSPRVRWFLWVFSVAMILTAGTAFLFKLIEFFVTATSEGPSALASFLIPVLNYLLVATGFLFLFLWAYFSGQFRDVESAKYRMLEMQEQINKQESQNS